MIKIVTKKEYWDVIDSGITKTIPSTKIWHMKDVQDTIAYSKLHFLKNKRIGEIGAGESRILSNLAQANECFAIDEYKGQGNGPIGLREINGVTIINASIGDQSPSISDNFFDVIFSISVIEHIQYSKLKDFFRDCYRILKSKGIMVHLVDIYVEDNQEENRFVFKKIREYIKPFHSGLFNPVGEMLEYSKYNDIKFSCSYATNPDNAMMAWNIMAPELKAKRERAQSCTLLIIGSKC